MKCALITGASSGIGRGAAVRLALAGWRILAQGRRANALAETLEEVRAAGAEGESFVAEMANMDNVEALAAWATSSGRLDAMIHCAAKFSYGPVSTERFWDSGPNAGLHGPSGPDASETQAASCYPDMKLV